MKILQYINWIKPIAENTPIEVISLLEEEDIVPEVKKAEPVRKSKRIRKPPVRFAQVSDMPEDLQKTMIDVMLSLPIGIFPLKKVFNIYLSHQKEIPS